MGIKTCEDDLGTSPGTRDGLKLREQLGAVERRVLRERISTAVRERELADEEAWRGKRANGRAATRRRP